MSNHPTPQPPLPSSAPDGAPVRHILSLSGGKDSTALAIYMRDRVAEMEYVFCDTGEELPETYDYLLKLEAFLGRPITRLNPDRPFSHYLELWNNNLPDARTRWCTRMLKLIPFEKHVGTDPVLSYIGVRHDEQHRTGYVSTKTNITTVFPFVQDGLGRADIERILHDSGLGMPEYYQWRSRSGCYFCFFQQRVEWVGLREQHPDLFEKSKTFEKFNEATGKRYTWNQRESLDELEKPERIEEIRAQAAERVLREAAQKKNKPLLEILDDDEDGEEPCLMCHF